MKTKLKEIQKGKRKLLALLTALAMVLTLLPGTALAFSEGANALDIENVEQTSATSLDLVVYTGETLTAYYIVCDTETAQTYGLDDGDAEAEACAYIRTNGSALTFTESDYDEVQSGYYKTVSVTGLTAEGTYNAYVVAYDEGAGIYSGIASNTDITLLDNWLFRHAASYEVGAKDETAKTLTISSEEEFALFAYELWQESLVWEYGTFRFNGFPEYGSRYEGWKIILNGDLDLSLYNWIPVPLPYLTFEGRGHTISRLHVEDYIRIVPLSDGFDDEGYDSYVESAGLFALLDRTNIYDLILESPDIEPIPVYADHKAAGALAGIAQGAGLFDITVNDPSIAMLSSDSTSTETMFIGGVAGLLDRSAENNIVGLDYTGMNNMEVHGGDIALDVITLFQDEGNAYVGGIAGANYAGVILNSYVSSDTEISVSKSDDESSGIGLLEVGGIAGYTSADTIPELGTCLLNNLSMADIQIEGGTLAATLHVGGIAGEVHNDSILSNLYIGPLSEDGGETGEAELRGAFGKIENDEDYFADNNFGYPDAASAFNDGVYATLNDDTPETGALSLAANVSIAHSGLDPEIVLPLFKRWAASETAPQFGDYYAKIEAPTWEIGQAIELAAPEIFALFDTETYPSHLIGTEITRYEVSSNGTGGWSPFTAATATADWNGKYLRYYANDMQGNIVSSNVVQMTVIVPAPPGGGGSSTITITKEKPAPVTFKIPAVIPDGGTTLSSEAANVTILPEMLNTIPDAEGKTVEIVIGGADKSALSAEVQTAIGDKPVVEISLTLDGVQTDWSNPSAPVTIAIPYTPTAAELANPEGIVVWYIDGAGNVQTVPNGRYDAASGKVVFSTTHFSLYAVAYNFVSFADVPGSAWFNQAVTFLAARGITAGTTATTFSPYSRITRSDCLVLMMRANGLSPDANPADNFSDAGNKYYTGYLGAAKRLGITAGIGDNTYVPAAQITRQEMFTLLYNALKSIGQLPQGRSGKTLSDFSDAGQVAPWAQEAMSLLVETGTVGGSKGMLNPTGTTTRAEMAQVLYNLLGN